jgi:hypothetical protein
MCRIVIVNINYPLHKLIDNIHSPVVLVCVHKSIDSIDNGSVVSPRKICVPEDGCMTETCSAVK